MATFFDRLGHVEIFYKRIISPKVEINILKSLEDIDFKFRVKKICDMTSTNSEASVSILGLSRESIHRLTTLRPVGVEQTFKKRIRVYASYNDFGDNLIFDGDIVKSQPSIPPENWLNISAFVGNYRHNELYSSAVNGGMRIRDLMKSGAKILDLNGVEFVDADVKEVKDEMNRHIKGFDCSGTKYDLLQMLNRVSDFIVFEDNGRLVCKLRDDERRSRKTAAVLSESSGMIGIPEVIIGKGDDDQLPLRMSVKCFINPSIQLWDRVYLQSVYLPDANGFYVVNEIEYEGHLRGQEWYMTLTLTSVNQ